MTAIQLQLWLITRDYMRLCVMCQTRAIMPNPHGDPLLKQPLMKLQPQAYNILFGKPGFVSRFYVILGYLSKYDNGEGFKTCFLRKYFPPLVPKTFHLISLLVSFYVLVLFRILVAGHVWQTKLATLLVWFWFCLVYRIYVDVRCRSFCLFFMRNIWFLHAKTEMFCWRKLLAQRI